MPKHDYEIPVSEALARVASSETMVITQTAREMRARGLDVISLSVGEPDFDTPDHIKRAAVDAIARGETNYTNADGMIELKQAICDKFKRENGLTYTPEQINVSPGGKPVIYNAFVATLNAGDEVIVPTPCWVSYPEMVRLAGGTPVLAPAAMEDGFKLSAQTLEALITPRTKWLILNSPSNPTGAAYSREELESLAQVLRGHPHVMVLTDDMYEHLMYDGHEFVTIVQVAPDLYERTLTMNGVSKAYAMTGWRIGYAGGPKALIKSMAKVMSQSTSSPCSISQWASVAALQGGLDFMTPWKSAFVQRRDTIVQLLNEAEGLTCLTPQGAFYAYPNCQQLLGKVSPKGVKITDDVVFCKALLDEAHVAVVPGTAFHSSPNFRISYATDLQTLINAGERIQTFCARLR